MRTSRFLNHVQFEKWCFRNEMRAMQGAKTAAWHRHARDEQRSRATQIGRGNTTSRAGRGLVLSSLVVALLACSSDSPVASLDAGFTDGSMDVPPSCAPAQSLCGRHCRELQTDEMNCGTCGSVCGDLMLCVAGNCQLRCPGTQVACASQCVNLQTDTGHCGDCDRACPSGQVCSLGRCTTTCAPSLATCGGGDAGAGDGGLSDGGSVAYCSDPQSDRMNCGACGNACPAGHICEDRVCRLSCAAGQTACGESCRDLQTDLAHCGACGTSCPAGSLCSLGVCGATCAAPLSLCGVGPTSSCANLLIDPANCGACGAACALAGVASGGCASGACTVVRCNAGSGDCDGTASNGCEAEMQTDPMHCGGCGRACALSNATAACVAGGCVVTACAAGFADCDRNPVNGCEVNTQTENTNCGACGTSCRAGSVCSRGVCGTTCAAPLATCGAASSAFCANTQIDPANCGGCGALCAVAGVAVNGCTGGVCTVVRCNPGVGDCDGAAPNGCETNTQTSALNCGACGRACALPNATASCGAGACVIASCAPGFLDCDRSAANGCEVNTQTDNGNCGACGASCRAGSVCSRGVCGTTCGAPLATCGTLPSTFCANTQIDPANCGRCGSVCALSGVAANGCAGGVCTVVRCNAGVGDCDSVASNGCETNTLTSASSCGACGRVCALTNATAACASGSCAIRLCVAGFRDCDGDPADGCEVNTQTDNANCGACGTSCLAGSVCSRGACSTTCAPPLATCGTLPSTFCANTQIDPANCGRCGALCAVAGVAVNGCTGGVCTVVRCNPGVGDCDGAAPNGCETNTQTSALNCGACGRVCALPNATAACASGACVIAGCSVGTRDCDGNPANGCEVNTQTDNGNCGACGTACGAGSVCSGGSCGATCAPPLSTCGTAPGTFCANTGVDPANCGVCGNICALPNVAAGGCSGGACTVVRCNGGTGDCDTTASNGCETNTQTSLAHCGGCNRTCVLANASSACTSGACVVLACLVGFADCDGVASNGCETNTGSDRDHCGACAISCAAGQVCSGALCVASCGGGLTDCSGSCRNLRTDPDACGSCMNACPSRANAARVCVGSTCGFTCNSLFADCNRSAADGCEVSLANNVNNCGGCGVVCPVRANMTATCSGSACGAVCRPGFADCNRVAADGCEVSTTTDTVNCGRCGGVCAPGLSCELGVCAGGASNNLSVGGAHACARRAAGTVVCWGRNRNSELGNNSTGNSSVPVSVIGLTNAAQVTAGGSWTGSGFSCARTVLGTVGCWGANFIGQLGIATTRDAGAPVNVVGLTDAVQVAAGDRSGCARRVGGSVVCWGLNNYGQLGNNTMTNSTIPVNVVGIIDAVQLAAGYNHTCARRASGAVLCWGRGIEGQLGNGILGISMVPVSVNGISDAVHIAAGLDHTCAVRATGTTLCWGGNAYGALGNNTTTNSSLPVSVLGMTDAVQVTAAEFDTCALRSTGAVACWGRNLRGELGNGTLLGSLAPRDVVGLSDAVEIDAGGNTVCARRPTGAVRCWGSNSSGQLGNGTTVDSTRPVNVIGLP